MPAGMVPSPTGRANPYNAMTTQQYNPVFDNIMRYQLGRQTNQSGERNVQTNAQAALLQQLLTNPGIQASMGSVNNTATMQGIINGGGASLRGGQNVQLSNTNPRKHQAEMQRAQRMQTAATQGQAGKAGRTFGQVPTNEGYMRPMTEQETLTSIITNAAAAKPNSEIRQVDSVKNEVSVPTITPEGNYGVGTQTTESEASAKAKVFSPAAIAEIERLRNFNPATAAAIDSGQVTVEEVDGALLLYINGTFLKEIPLTTTDEQQPR